MKIAFLFAGQGAQEVGMGQDFYQNYELAKNLFDEFPVVRDLCFNGPKETLTETKNAQPAILLDSFIIAQILKEKGIEPEFACGLSLGEYSALAFAGVWPLNDAMDIISRRGDIMQHALPLGTSKMAAVMNMDRNAILDAIKDVKGVCEIANYNCPGQIVITGDNAGVDEGILKLKEAGCKRIVELQVSGAFHSSLLIPASHELRAKLDEYKPAQPQYKIVYNVSGKEETKDINEILEAQICHSVYFEDTIKYLSKQGVDTFVEVGPGKSLSSFVKRTLTDVKIYNISNVSQLEAFLAEVKGEN